MGDETDFNQIFDRMKACDELRDAVKELQRQRDVALEALRTISTWSGSLDAQKVASKALEEIEK